MRITEAATNAIINVMKSKGLDTKKTYLEIGVFEGNLGIGFTREPVGKTIKSGELMLVTSSKLDTEGVIIDFGEVNGKMGLIFLGEENVNHNN